MLKMNRVEILQQLCKTTNSWGLYLLVNTEHNMPGASLAEKNAETVKAAPYLKIVGEHLFSGYNDESMWILCDSAEECYTLFNQTVGDEGPTATNPYEGPGNVFAMIISNSGRIVAENT